MALNYSEIARIAGLRMRAIAPRIRTRPPIKYNIVDLETAVPPKPKTFASLKNSSENRPENMNSRILIAMLMWGGLIVLPNVQDEPRP